MTCMHATKSFVRRFARCESGQTAIEYALIMALIFLVIVGAITTFAQNATDKMKMANEAIINAG